MAKLALLALLICFVICVSGQQPILTSRDPLAVAEQVAIRVTESQQIVRDIEVPDLLGYTKSLIVGKGSSLEYLKGDVSECGHSMLQFGLDIARLQKYSLKMVDAWGKLPSGLERGNVMWMGRYYECLEAHSQNFSGKWCLLGFGSTVNPLTNTNMSTAGIGMCLPNTCSQEQISSFFLNAAPKLSPVISCPVQPTNYTSVDIVAMVICMLLTLAMLVGTSYELYEMYFADRMWYQEILNDVPAVQLPETAKQQNSKFARFRINEIVLSFSVITNTRMILNTSQKEGNINVLHGIRFISMSWVILGHVFVMTSQIFDNIFDFVDDIVSHGSSQAILNATYSVDSFFFLSGLLVAYLGMREIERNDGKLRIFWGYLYRYLRLTPAYALCILVVSSIYSKMGDGPTWSSSFEAIKEPCTKYWWTNLLYINNLHPTTLFEECFVHGWYLANDMQFFLLSPFILLLLYTKPRIGQIVLASGLFLSVITTLSLSWHFQEQPSVIGLGNILKMMVDSAGMGPKEVNVTTPAPPPNQLGEDQFFSDLYAKPWCRIGVYLIGMTTGYYLNKNNLRLRMNKVFALFMWGVATITALAVIYGLWPHAKGYEISLISVGVSALYNAVSRPLWALCLAWVVIACVSGYGGPINAFLSWKLFIPLSRLTYCAYLVHPVVIGWFIAIEEARMHYSVTVIAINFLGILLLSYGIAFVLSIAIEMPMIGIMKIFFPNKKSQKNNVMAFTNHVQEADA